MSVGYSDTSATSDSLGVERYYEGLSQFIATCETPMTLSIQGDWGTGKTTALNLIEKKISEKNCKVLWFRTWQYASLGMDENLTLVLINNLYEKLLEVAGGKTNEEHTKPFAGIKELLKMGVDYKFGGECSDRFEKAYNALFNIETVTSVTKEIEQTKDNMQRLINSELGADERIVVFVDDLDRLEPRVAVELLEGIKNFMDCDKCVFVLAVDSSVIYQGINSKYGEDVGEEKAKKFFDKIIQVPFHVPVTQYAIKEYISGFVGKEDTNKEKYEYITKAYLKNNPRGIKRAFNLLELYKFILPDIDDNEKLFYLFLILVLQMDDEGKYKKMVEDSRSGMSLQDILGEERKVLEKPLAQILPVEEDSEEMKAEKEAKAMIFIDILNDAAKSSGNESVENTEEDSIGEETKISGLEEALLRHPYVQKVISKNQRVYMTIPSGNEVSRKACMIKETDGGTTNIVVYSPDGKPLDSPSKHGFTKAENRGSKDCLNWLHSKNYITLVGVPDDFSQDILKRFMMTYGILGEKDFVKTEE